MVRAYFSYVPGGLSIRFLNLSSGNPLSFSWNFGVTPTAESTDSEPIFLYGETGVYQVTLTVTDGTDTDTITLPVGVSSDTSAPASPTLILDAVLGRMPQTINLTIPTIDTLIKKWQLFLMDLIDPNITVQNVYNESAWPFLVNSLITELCLYDILTDYLMGAALVSVNSSQTSGGGTGEGGSLKKVVTGPSEAEWYSSAEGASQVSDSVSVLSKPGGLKDQIQNRACILSKKLMIPLEICTPIAWKPRAPSIISISTPSPLDQDVSRNNTYEDLHTNPLNVHDS